MHNSRVRIKYGNYAVGAKESFVPSASETYFDNIVELSLYNISVRNYSNPCEAYQMVLDGTAVLVSENDRYEQKGYWSRQISDENGVFSEPIFIYLDSEYEFTSKSISFLFDVYNGIYPTDVYLAWYRDGEVIADERFQPSGYEYNVEKNVENYDALEVVVYSINAPHSRLRIRSIDHGEYVWFESYECRNVRINQEISPISTELGINTADMTIDIDDNAEYFFQRKQPMYVYFDDELMSATFITSFHRKTKNMWSFQTEDYIGLMDGIPYKGGVYENYDAVDLLNDIFMVSRVPYRVDEALIGSKVSGYIPYTNCREALMQVCLAIGAVVDTSNIDFVKVFRLHEEVVQSIPLERIMQGQSIDEEGAVTGVSVVFHEYRKSQETINLYSAESSGGGENIFIKFSQPVHDLQIYDGEFVEKGTNYAIINAGKDCSVFGKKYAHSEFDVTKNNPNVFRGEPENIVSVSGATLVSKNNIDKILEMCYNYIIKRKVVKSKIVEGKHRVGALKYGQARYGTFFYGSGGWVYDSRIHVGDTIEVDSAYEGKFVGVVISQAFSLNSGIIIKDTVVR